MEVIVGTAGHIDHGKTALVKVLTGTDTDRLPEEKKRGITIDLGFAEMRSGDVHFGFVDVPGHERFVKNMLAGASGIDLVLLVVAADEGVMPQTREHFDICRLLDLRAGVIALTKADLVDEETLEIAKLDVAELVDGTFLAKAPVVAVSSRTGTGVDKLQSKLLSESRKIGRRRDHLISRLPVDRAFSVKGFGTVVTGTLASGSLHANDQLELLPEQRSVRVRGLQTHGSATETIVAGQRTAVNLAGVDTAEIERGTVLVEHGVLDPTQVFDARMELLSTAPRAARSRQRVRVHVGTAEALARLAIIDETGQIDAGSSGFVQVRLESPVAVIPGDRFIIRSYSPQITIGGGVVLDNAPTRHRRREIAETEEYLTAISMTVDQPASLVREIVSNAGETGLSMRGIRARTGLTTSAAEAAVSDAKDRIVQVGDTYLSREASDRLNSAVFASLDAFHRREPLATGMSREMLSETISRGPRRKLSDDIVEGLIAEGKITAERGTVRSLRHVSELSPSDQRAADAIMSALNAAGLEVPKIDDLLRGLGPAMHGDQLRKLLRLLVDRRDIVKVSEDFYFSSPTIDRLVTRLRDAVKTTEPVIDVPRFKEIAGVSRKYAIPLLEYFDREHITARRGDKRVVL